MFVNAILNGTSYCGPTVLSAITGIGTLEISRIIRFGTNKRFIKGMSNRQLEKVLTFFGIKFTKKSCKGTLNNWVYDYCRRDVTYIVNVSSHYLAIRNNQVVCTQFDGIITPLSSSKYLRSHVKTFWIIESEPKKVQLPPLKEKPPSQKKRVLALCKELEIQIDISDYENDGSSIWMFLSDKMIKEKFNGVDPWDDEHFVCDYDEAFQKVTDLLLHE